MNTDRSIRHQFPFLVLILASWGFICLLFAQPDLWYRVIGPYHIIPPYQRQLTYPFLDMSGRLAHMERHAQGHDVYAEPNPLDPLGRTNAKPSFSLALGHLGLGFQHLLEASLTALLAYLVFAFGYLRPKSWLESALSLAVILSPSVLLALERANDDIVVFSVLAPVPLLLARMGSVQQGLGLGLITLAMAIKVFPAAGFAVLLRRGKNLSQTWVFLFLGAAAVASYGLLSYAELSQLSGRFPSPQGIGTFGILSFFDAMDLESVRQEGRWFTLGAGLILALTLVFRRPLALAPASPFSEYAFLLGSSVLTFCYFLNTNHDYRFCFVPLLVPYVFAQIRSGRPVAGIMAWVFVLLMLIAMWIEYINLSLSFIPTQPPVWDFSNVVIYFQLKQVAAFLFSLGMIGFSATILRPSILALLESMADQLRHIRPATRH